MPFTEPVMSILLSDFPSSGERTEISLEQNGRVNVTIETEADCIVLSFEKLKALYKQAKKMLAEK